MGDIAYLRTLLVFWFSSNRLNMIATLFIHCKHWISDNWSNLGRCWKLSPFVSSSCFLTWRMHTSSCHLGHNNLAWEASIIDFCKTLGIVLHIKVRVWVSIEFFICITGIISIQGSLIICNKVYWYSKLVCIDITSITLGLRIARPYPRLPELKVICHFGDKVSLCNPGWPQTHSLPASVSWVAGLQNVPPYLNFQ